MKVYDAANIRNVALVGHSGSGKTQLTSAALFDAGAINRFGKVDDGTTVTDFDEEEIVRKHTLSASLAYAEWNKTKINLIDTPGIGEFPGRRACGPARGRRSDRRRRCGARRAGADGKDLAGRRGDGAAAAGRRQSARSRARQPGTHPEIDSWGAQPHRHPGAAADRRGEIVPRRRGSRGAEGVRVSDRRQRQVQRVCRSRPRWPPRRPRHGKR